MKEQVQTLFKNRFIEFPEVTYLTSLKKTALYELIKMGELSPVKLGRKTVFLESEVISWVANKIAEYRKSAEEAK